MKRLNTTGNRREYLIKGLKFNYDNLNDLLYVYKENSSVYANVVIGDFHVEFSKEWQVVGIEILNASDLLGEYDVSKDMLENIKKIEIKIVNRDNSLLIFLMIASLADVERAVPITMNNFESPIMQALQ